MADLTTLRRRRNIAYACFLLIGATALLGSLGSLLPAALVEPAYFAFFVLMPLTLASAIALIAAAALVFVVGRNDPILIMLLTFTGIVITFAIADFSDSLPGRSDVPVANVLITVYGLATLWTCIHWFAVRRRQE